MTDSSLRIRVRVIVKVRVRLGLITVKVKVEVKVTTLQRFVQGNSTREWHAVSEYDVDLMLHLFWYWTPKLIQRVIVS